MSPRPRPSSRARARPRDRILEQAVDLLALHGLDAMTMRQLGERVGLDNSSLYRHFASKAELVDAALDRVAGEVLSHIEASVDLARPLTLKGFEDACADVGRHLFDHPQAARLLLHWFLSMGPKGPGFAASALATDVERPHGRLFEGVRRWLASGVRRGVLRKHAQPEAIVILFGAMLLRPATYGHLLRSLEPGRDRAAARDAWERELREVVRGAFGP